MANIAKLASAVVKIEMLRELSTECWLAAVQATENDAQQAEIERLAHDTDAIIGHALDGFVALWNATGETERSAEFASALAGELERYEEKLGKLWAMRAKLSGE